MNYTNSLVNFVSRNLSAQVINDQFSIGLMYKVVVTMIKKILKNYTFPA